DWSVTGVQTCALRIWDLWVENRSRLPATWGITVSDASVGMVAHARQRLSPAGGVLTFAVVDAQALPFATASMDAVIANHMLNHRSEERRVGKECRSRV